ncbi:MAG: hypothetical protein LBS46_05760 [Dysgonamonadaceae bacterium]|jgi:hypothetical protein|nr:hypothetical protein [Dysgonamonadaceae bacterium]
MFQEVDPVYLYQVGLGTELDGFGFLASDDGADIVLVDTHDPARHRLSGTVHLPLLGEHLPYDITPLVMETVRYQLLAILCFYRGQLSVQLSKQVDQN